MATQKYIRTEYADGSVVLSNVRNKDTDETYSLSKVTEFVSGVPMDDSHCDGKIFRKLGSEYFADVDFLAGKDIPLAKFGKIYTDNTTSNDDVFQRALSFFRMLSRAITTTTSMPALLLPPGRLMFTQGWVIDFDGFNVVGCGRRGTVLSYNGTGTAIQLGDETARASYYKLGSFSIRDFNNTAEIGIDFQRAYEGEVNDLWILGQGILGFSTSGVRFSTVEGNRSWTNSLNRIRVTNIAGEGFLFTGLAPNAIFLNDCSAGHVNHAVWIENGNGIKFKNFQSEDSHSGHEVRISPYEGTSSRVLSITFDSPYFEVGGSEPLDRIFYISTKNKNGIEQDFMCYGLDIKNPYLWGGNFAEYAVELDVLPSAPSGLLYGTISGGFIHGFQKAIVKSESARERMRIDFGISRDGFAVGNAIPAIESLSGLSGCLVVQNNEKSILFSKPVTLPKLTSAQISAVTPELGSIWYSQGFDKLQYTNNAGETKSIIVNDATTGEKGVVELATPTETEARASGQVVVTPISLSGLTASESRSGFIELATQPETNAGTDDTRAVTPLKLQTKLDNTVATTTVKGLVNQAAASPDTATIPSGTYSQSEVEAILTELRDLKNKLRAAGILA